MSSHFLDDLAHSSQNRQRVVQKRFHDHLKVEKGCTCQLVYKQSVDSTNVNNKLVEFSSHAMFVLELSIVT